MHSGEELYRKIGALAYVAARVQARDPTYAASLRAQVLESLPLLDAAVAADVKALLRAQPRSTPVPGRRDALSGGLAPKVQLGSVNMKKKENDRG